MMDVVTVKRKGHPLGTVRVERGEMLPGDVVVGEKQAEPEQKQKRSYNKRGAAE